MVRELLLFSDSDRLCHRSLIESGNNQWRPFRFSSWQPFAPNTPYDLSPMQAGMLYRSLLGENGTRDGYDIEQMHLVVSDELLADAFSRAWTLVARRHPSSPPPFIGRGRSVQSTSGGARRRGGRERGLERSRRRGARGSTRGIPGLRSPPRLRFDARAVDACDGIPGRTRSLRGGLDVPPHASRWSLDGACALRGVRGIRRVRAE